MTIYYNVVKELPEGEALNNLKFRNSACFADWPYNTYKGYYSLDRSPEASGWFVLVADAFRGEHFKPIHEKLFDNLIAWMAEHGFTARWMMVEKTALDYGGKDDVGRLVFDVPLLAVHFTPDDNASMIYNALCTIRYFTSEFFGAIDPIETDDLETMMGVLFSKNRGLDNHMPFSTGSFLYCSWGPPNPREPSVDGNLGKVYWRFLSAQYKTRYWETQRPRKMGEGMQRESGTRFWWGGLNGDTWRDFYHNEIVKVVAQTMYGRKVEAPEPPAVEVYLAA